MLIQSDTRQEKDQPACTLLVGFACACWTFCSPLPRCFRFGRLLSLIKKDAIDIDQNTHRNSVCTCTYQQLVSCLFVASIFPCFRRTPAVAAAHSCWSFRSRFSCSSFHFAIHLVRCVVPRQQQGEYPLQR